MKLIIITIIRHHNSKHYIHSIFINTYDNYPTVVYPIRNGHFKMADCKSLQSTEISLYLAFTNESNVAQKEKNIDE
jgi:hypothetical protein